MAADHELRQIQQVGFLSDRRSLTREVPLEGKDPAFPAKASAVASRVAAWLPMTRANGLGQEVGSSGQPGMQHGLSRDDDGASSSNLLFLDRKGSRHKPRLVTSTQDEADLLTDSEPMFI